MAKIIPSALITSIKGTISGNTFQGWKDSITIRKTPYKSSVVSAKSSLIKGINSTIAGCYYSLSESNKNGWSYFASLISSTLSGTDAFQSVNVANLSREHPALCAYDVALCFYNKPFTPVYVSGRFSLKKNTFEFYWGTPACATVYVTGYYSPQVGYSNANNPTWKMGQTVLSDLGRICFDASEYQSGQVFRLRGQSITPYGITSSNSATASATKSGSFEYQPLLFIIDSEFNKVMKFQTPSRSFVNYLETWDSGADYFQGPDDCCSDEDYLYVVDTYNHRIVKFNKTDLSFISEFGSEGTGDSNFKYPTGICCDDTYLYICDTENHRIKKHLKSDLSFVFTFGSYGSDDDNFNLPRGIFIYNSQLYITDTGNNRFKMHVASDGDFITEFGHYGSGDGDFDNPIGICCNAQYTFIIDNGNNRVSVWGNTTFSHIVNFGSIGSGDTEFDYPYRCCLNSDYLFITDIINFRVVYYNLTTLSFSGKFGQEGEAPWQFAVLSGVCTMTSTP